MTVGLKVNRMTLGILAGSAILLYMLSILGDLGVGLLAGLGGAIVTIMGSLILYTEIGVRRITKKSPVQMVILALATLLLVPAVLTLVGITLPVIPVIGGILKFIVAALAVYVVFT